LRFEATVSAWEHSPQALEAHDACGEAVSEWRRCAHRVRRWCRGGATTGVKDVGGLTQNVGNVSGALYFYPAPTSGFFVKGGVGLASYQVSQGNTTSTSSGFGLLGQYN
jgi:hypothetical protein